MKRLLPLIVIGAAYFAAVLIWIANDRRIAQKSFDAYSAANTSPNGLSLAMKYLARTGRRNVNMLTTPPNATLPHDAVLFRVVEGQELTPLEMLLRAREEDEDEDDEQPVKGKKAAPKKKRVLPILAADEESFVRNGGRLVIAAGGTYGSLSTRNGDDKNAIKVFPIWPGLDRVSLPIARTLQGEDVLRHMHALYVVDEYPAIARATIGKGDLILLGAPELFDNEHVSRHLDLLTALTADRRAIYFDETVHGLVTDFGMLELLRAWRLGPMLFLLLVLAIVTIWRGARRVGNPEDDYRETRSDAVDLVASLGALYDATMSRAEAIALYQQAFTQSVAAQTGLRGEQLQKRVALLCKTGSLTRPEGGLENPPHMTIEEFNRDLTALNEAFRRLEHAEHH